jgi:hypothetical protein
MVKKAITVSLLLLVAFGLLKLFFFTGLGPVPGEVVTPVPASTTGADSVELVAGGQYGRGRMGRFFLGGYYRDVWATPVRVPVLDMRRHSNGLSVDKRGGGQQTTSFTLSTEEGLTYALRSVNKDPLPILPPFWQNTVAGRFIRDQVSATHPYGALVVPALARATGVFHANPRLVYVRADEARFAEYPGYMGGKLFMLEEKFSSQSSIRPQLGPAVDIENTHRMLHKRFRYNSHRIDQRAFARARLLDLLIGDWDRHKGQWNWAVYEEGDRTIYRPIPKDRDQAFSYFRSGLLPSLASRLVPPLRKFTSFQDDFGDISGLTINAAFLDERALPELTAADFQAIAKDMQASLTDQVIGQAVRSLPGPVYLQIGPEMERKLKRRRDQLPAAAQAYYQVLAREVTVVGSDEEERFVVRRLNDGETAVEVFRLKGKGEKEELLYSRLFQHQDTQQITLHGLGGDDKFEVSGSVTSGIPVVIVGGEGEDEITDRSSVRSWGKKTFVYDTSRGNELDFGAETSDQTSSDVRVHAYDREGF